MFFERFLILLSFLPIVHPCDTFLLARRYAQFVDIIYFVLIPRLWIRLGDNDLKSPYDDSHAIEIPVSSVHIHPLYKYLAAYYDVALMRLSTPVVFNDFVLPICLPPAASFNPDIYAGKSVKVTGWGDTERNDPIKNYYLRRAKVRVFEKWSVC